MNASLDIAYWLFQVEAWVVVGIVLMIVDIFVGSMFILPIGVAFFLVGCLLFVDQQRWFEALVLFETWQGLAITFAVIAVLSIWLIKFVLQDKLSRRKDINEY